MAIDSESKQWLTGFFGNNVRFDEPMSRHTSLRVGGPAEAFVVPETLEALKALIQWAWSKGIPCRIVGDGTNLLVKDNGIRGITVVLTKCLKKISHTQKTAKKIIVAAMAGARIQALCRYAIDHGLAGLNFALGIPGTVGGGIVMNAGTSYGWMESVLNAVTVLLPTGETRKIPRERLEFSYRRLSWDLGEDQAYRDQAVVVEGFFCLEPSDPQKLKQAAAQILTARRQSQPLDLPNAGCFFKNPASGTPAGKLIDLAGLKGKSIGGAQVSTKHANFFVNTGHASAADFLALTELVRKTVSAKFNIDLQSEVKIVGT
ncbi:MAG: UDP-N-acetylmuramate dehydrogenase [Proteobacteria bacterium]|nr:UDP-N-acetylmuramate dehydrogenase [Pseudomonadota bacterium]